MHASRSRQLFLLSVMALFTGGCRENAVRDATRAVAQKIDAPPAPGVDHSAKRVTLPTDRAPNRCELYFMVKYGQFADLERVFAAARANPVGFYRGFQPLYALYDQMDGFGHPFSEQQWEDHFSQLAAWSRAYPDSPAPLG